MLIGRPLSFYLLHGFHSLTRGCNVAGASWSRRGGLSSELTDPQGVVDGPSDGARGSWVVCWGAVNPEEAPQGLMGAGGTGQRGGLRRALRQSPLTQGL